MAKAKDKQPGFLIGLARFVGSLAGSARAVAIAAPPEDGAAQPQLRHEEVRFEHSDIDARGVVITGVSVLAGALILSGLVWIYATFLVHERADTSPPPLPIELHGNPIPPAPRLQESPTRDLRDLKIYEDSVLGAYSWIDRSKGVAGIPIERAMELIATRGITPQKAFASLNLFHPAAGTRLTGLEGKVEPEPR